MEAGKYKMIKDDVIKWFGKLPTVKESRIISRQIGHPLGTWTIDKPTRKHEYILTVEHDERSPYYEHMQEMQ